MLKQYFDKLLVEQGLLEEKLGLIINTLSEIDEALMEDEEEGSTRIEYADVRTVNAEFRRLPDIVHLQETIIYFINLLNLQIK